MTDFHTGGRLVVDADGVNDEGGHITLDSGDPAYPDYRIYTKPNDVDPADRVHFISSYNLRWDAATGTWTKEDAARAGFHMVLESEWERTIEWNFDHTLAGDTSVRRVMAMRTHVETGRATWSWETDPAQAAGMRFGLAGPTCASWESDGNDADVEFTVRSGGTVRTARVNVVNDAGLGLHAVATGSGHGPSATAFGLPFADAALLYTNLERLAMGTAGAHPAYFFTDSKVRGGISATGEWFRRHYNGTAFQDVPLSTVESLFPLRPGTRYQSQFATTPTTVVLAADTTRAAPFMVSRPVTVDRIGIAVTVPAPGSTLHLGIYADDGTGRPGARLLDTGALDGATVGTREPTVAQYLAPGLYWLVVGAKGGSPAIGALTGGGGWMLQQDSYTGAVRNGYCGTMAGAALDAAFGAVTLATEVPRILVRAQ
jgi:hypothetical protein